MSAGPSVIEQLITSELRRRHSMPNEDFDEAAKAIAAALFLGAPRIVQISSCAFTLASGMLGETLVALGSDGRINWRVFLDGEWQSWESMRLPPGYEGGGDDPKGLSKARR